MQRAALIGVFLLAGCSTAPIADLLDWWKPGRMEYRGVEPYGGVGANQPILEGVPVEPGGLPPPHFGIPPHNAVIHPPAPPLAAPPALPAAPGPAIPPTPSIIPVPVDAYSIPSLGPTTAEPPL